MKIKILKIILSALISVLLFDTKAANHDNMSIVAKFTDKAPVLDGKLNEKSWQNANWQERFRVLKKNKTSSNTQAAVLFDTAFLYIAFKCAHPQPDKMKKNKFRHDGSVGTNESLELFIDPGTNGRTYMHFFLDAANQRSERIVKNAGINPDVSWNPTWHSAVNINKNAWNAEIAIPLYVIVRNGSLDLKMNLARNLRYPKAGMKGKKIRYNSKFFTLAPVEKSFKETYNFLTVKGLKCPKLHFMATIEKAAVEPYYIKNGKYFCNIIVSMKSHTAKPGNIKLKISDFPKIGKSLCLQKKIAMAAYENKKFTFPWEIAKPGERKFKLEIFNSGGKTPLQSVYVDNCVILNIISCYLKKNYYTSEENSMLICRLGLPGKELNNWKLQLKSPDGKILLTRNGNINRRMMIRFPIKTLSNGENHLSLLLRNASGTLIFQKKLDLLKLKPSKASEVKIDRVSCMLLKDGKPFFPIGLNIRKTDKEFLRQINNDKFNTVFFWKWPKKITNINKYFRNAEISKLSVIASPTGYSPKRFKKIVPYKKSANIKFQKNIFNTVKDTILESVESIKNFKPLLAYNTLMPANGFSPGFQSFTFKKAFNKIDPYHPDLAIFNNMFTVAPDIIRSVDIIGIDPLWIKARSKSKCNVIKESARVMLMSSLYAKKYRKPVWAVPLAPFFASVHERVRPDFKAEYLKPIWFTSVIHGARGVFYCANSSMCKKTGKEKYRKFLNEAASTIENLLPFLTQAEPASLVKYNDSLLLPEEDIPDIIISIRKNSKNNYILLAANTSLEKTLKTEFKVSGLSDKVNEIYSGKSLKVTNSSFIDNITPLGCKAYLMGALQQNSNRIKVLVNFPVN